MNKGYYDKINKIITYIISYPYFTEFYTVISIILVILTIIVAGIDCFFSDLDFILPHLDTIDLLSKILFSTLFINLIFSTLTLIDQTQRIEILIYPLRFQINDFEKYYGIKDLISEKEINIEVFFLKKGLSKIILKDVNINFPEYWNLNLLQRSFLTPYTNAAIKSTNESIKINPNETIEINKKIDGLSANIYQFRVCDKNNLTLTSENFVVTIYYTIHILCFDLSIKKQMTAKIGDF